MRTDTEIKHDAIQILIKKLGILETERFMMLVNQQPMDYTQWRKNLPEYHLTNLQLDSNYVGDSSIEKLSNDAMNYRKKIIKNAGTQENIKKKT